MTTTTSAPGFWIWNRRHRLGGWARVARVESRQAAEAFVADAAGEWLVLPRGLSPGSGGRVGQVDGSATLTDEDDRA